MADDAPVGPAIPLARWADRQLRLLARLTGSEAIAELSGEELLAERALSMGFRIGATTSSGGGSRLLQTCDGWFALTLTRPGDRELLPALFGDAAVDVRDDTAIATAIASRRTRDLLKRGRELGLAVAVTDEIPGAAPVDMLFQRKSSRQREGKQPLVVDLSGIWAGPLAGHLLWLAGARVIKVESATRPDRMREAESTLFALLNQGKDSVVLDFAEDTNKSALLSMIRRADIVIEAARPRGLLQLGIDADRLVRELPGLIWLTITGHGARGEAANWIGTGHDCGVAAGLSKAMLDASGRIGFVGDALPDPLTGIIAAIEGWRAWQAGYACRIGFSLSAIAAQALAEESALDEEILQRELRNWRDAEGEPFPRRRRIRQPVAALHALGADTKRWTLPC